MKRVSVNVSSTNSAPLARSTSFDAISSKVKKVKLLASDKDGDTLHYKLAEDVKHGRLIFSGLGLVEYKAIDGYEGEDSFSYFVSDGKNKSEVQEVLINVRSVQKAQEPVSKKLERPLAKEDIEDIDYEKFKSVLKANASNRAFIEETRKIYPKAFAKFIKEMTQP